MASDKTTAILIAGIPASNPTLLLRVGLAAGDPAAWMSIDGVSTIIIRDIEKDRAQEAGKADNYASPADFTPSGGLDPDRETATAQAVAQCLLSKGVKQVITDRSLPYIFAWHLMQADIAVDYDHELGVLDRRI